MPERTAVHWKCAEKVNTALLATMSDMESLQGKTQVLLKDIVCEPILIQLDEMHS